MEEEQGSRFSFIHCVVRSSYEITDSWRRNIDSFRT